jgi:hypothetical protein
MTVEKVMLGNGYSKIEIVDHGRINFSALKPSVGCRSCKNDGIFIGKTPLPATKG